MLFRNIGDGRFADVTSEAGIEDPGYYGFGVVFSDLDNDGWLDIYVANDAVPNLLFHNQRDGTFEEIGLLSGTALDETGQPQSDMGFDSGDYDQDGDRDAVAININDRPNLYRNDGGSRNHWLTMRLEGTRGNRDAIGARVEAEVEGATRVAEVRSGGSFLSHSGMRVHLGLGTATVVDRLQIRWPNGNTEEWTDVEGDRFIAIREGAGITVVAP